MHLRSGLQTQEIKAVDSSIMRPNLDQFQTVADIKMLDSEIDALLRDFFSLETLPAVDDIDLGNCEEESDQIPLFNFSVSNALLSSEIATELNHDSLLMPITLSTRFAQLATAYYEQGFVSSNNEDLKAAAANYQIALSISMSYIREYKNQKDFFCKNESQQHYKLIAKIIHYLGMICSHFNLTDLALLYYLIELKIRATLITQTKMKDLFFTINFLCLGNTHFKMNNHGKAIETYYYALVVSQSHYGEMNWLTGKGYYYLALTYHHIGHLSLLSAKKNIVVNSIKSAEKDIIAGLSNFNSASNFFRKAYQFYSLDTDRESINKSEEIQRNLDKLICNQEILLSLKDSIDKLKYTLSDNESCTDGKNQNQYIRVLTPSISAHPYYKHTTNHRIHASLTKTKSTEVSTASAPPDDHINSQHFSSYTHAQGMNHNPCIQTTQRPFFTSHQSYENKEITHFSKPNLMTSQPQVRIYHPVYTNHFSEREESAFSPKGRYTGMLLFNDDRASDIDSSSNLGMNQTEAALLATKTPST